jgi:hypothetical protein
MGLERKKPREPTTKALERKKSRVLILAKNHLERRESKRVMKTNIASDRRMGNLSDKSDTREVNIETVAKLFSSCEGTNAASVIKDYIKKMPAGETSVPIADLIDLTLRSNSELELTVAQRALADEIVNGSIEENLHRRDNYLNLLLFLLFYACYLFVVYSSNAPPSMAYDIQNAMEEQLLMKGGLPVEPFGSKDAIFEWVDDKVLPLFADPACGNGRCDAPVEHWQWGHSGCMADCGYYQEKTNTSLKIKVNFSKHMMLGEWSEDDWRTISWDLCSPTTHQSLCAYNQSQDRSEGQISRRVGGWQGRFLASV